MKTQIKKLKSKDWRVNHLYKIKDKQKQLITFKRNEVQVDFNKNKHSRNIILKSRQLGFTTEEAIDMLDDALFVRNFDGLFIAQDLDTAKDIFSNKIDLAWQNFKPELKEYYKTTTDSARQIKFDQGKGNFSSITVDNSGRSGTFSRLHITEFAKLCKMFPARAKEVLEGSIPAIPTNGRVDIESTAEESQGAFYEIFWEAWDRQGEPKETEFKAHFYNWTWDEEIESIEPEEVPQDFKDYQDKYELSDKEITYYYNKWLSLNKNWHSLRKEYPTTPDEAFQSSGNKLFDIDKINQMPIEEGEQVGDWVYYEKWDRRGRYVLASDVAEGVGQDSSTCVVWDFNKNKPKIVAEYANNQIEPDMFAYEVKAGGEKYGTCLIAIEKNNHGHTTLSKLKEIYPTNKIYKTKRDKDDNLSKTKKFKWGWETNKVSKPRMMFDLNTAINDELIEIPSKRIQSEMKRYDREELDDTKFDEESTKHWDLLIATAIGFQMKDKLEQKPSQFIPNSLDMSQRNKPSQFVPNLRRYH
jgi:hypothetical protein